MVGRVTQDWSLRTGHMGQVTNGTAKLSSPGNSSIAKRSGLEATQPSFVSMIRRQRRGAAHFGSTFPNVVTGWTDLRPRLEGALPHA